jgi:hypothetical protein
MTDTLLLWCVLWTAGCSTYRYGGARTGVGYKNARVCHSLQLREHEKDVWAAGYVCMQQYTLLTVQHVHSPEH